MKQYLAVVVVIMGILATSLSPVGQASAAVVQPPNYSYLCAPSRRWTLVKQEWSGIGWLVAYRSGYSLCVIHYNLSGSRQTMLAGIIRGTSEYYDYGRYLSYAGPRTMYVPHGSCATILGIYYYAFDRYGYPIAGVRTSFSVCN